MSPGHAIERELLEPHRGPRGWMVRWIQAAGRMPPRPRPRRPPPESGVAALSALRRPGHPRAR